MLMWLILARISVTSSGRNASSAPSRKGTAVILPKGPLPRALRQQHQPLPHQPSRHHPTRPPLSPPPPPPAIRAAQVLLLASLFLTLQGGEQNRPQMATPV